MTDFKETQYTAFDGNRKIATGTLLTVALAVKQAIEAGPDGTLLVNDHATGRMIDVDARGTSDDVQARYKPSDEPQLLDSEPTSAQNARGRPKLGVVAREVTLLPRHWDWLNEQPGGASVALRKLVEEARRINQAKDRIRRSQTAAYHFMSAMAGDLPNFEEASRALFANDRLRFEGLISAWPNDIRTHAYDLAFSALVPNAPDQTS